MPFNNSCNKLKRAKDKLLNWNPDSQVVFSASLSMESSEVFFILLKRQVSNIFDSRHTGRYLYDI